MLHTGKCSVYLFFYSSTFRFDIDWFDFQAIAIVEINIIGFALIKMCVCDHLLSCATEIVLAINTRAILHTTQGYQLCRSSEHDQNTQQQTPNLRVSCSGIHIYVFRFLVVHSSPCMVLCSDTGRHIPMMVVPPLKFLRRANMWNLCQQVVQKRCSSECKIHLAQL